MDIRALDEVARAQYGVVTSTQAIQHLGPSRKDRWVRLGHLVAVQPRVFRMAGSPVTWLQQLAAAQLSSNGLVSHRAAAEAWGLVRMQEHVEVAVEWKRQPRLWSPATVHRLVDLGQATAVTRLGLRMTDPVRTIVDLGLVLPPVGVSDALSTALGRHLLTISDLRRLRLELSRCGRTGVGIVGQILDERWPAGTEESALEGRILRLLRQHHVPEPVVQHEVWHAGRLVARIDLAYPALRLAIEVDGFEHHSNPDAFQRDRTRQNDLIALGWTVLRFTWEDVVRRPQEVVDAVRREIRRLTDSLCA
jgi:hypothetical protein